MKGWNVPIPNYGQITTPYDISLKFWNGYSSEYLTAVPDILF